MSHMRYRLLNFPDSDFVFNWSLFPIIAAHSIIYVANHVVYHSVLYVGCY